MMPLASTRATMMSPANVHPPISRGSDRVSATAAIATITPNCS